MLVNRITRIWKRIKQSWHPKPLEPPTVDPEFIHLNDMQRAGDSIRYGILSWEFWISPNGQVREWIRHNTRLALVLAPVVLVLIPLIGFGLAQLAAWTVALAIIAGHLIIVPILLLVAFLVISAAVKLIKALF